MAKPNNSIAKVKLPGENVERPIVPYFLAYSQSSNYVATLPNLTADAILALRSDLDTYVDKNNQENQTISSAIFFARYITIYDDVPTSGSDHRPTNIYNWEDNDVYIYSTGLYLSEVGALNFPNRSGVIGLEIDIVDLTQL